MTKEDIMKWESEIKGGLSIGKKNKPKKSLSPKVEEVKQLALKLITEHK
jgi:hypothetical protein